MKHSHQRVLQIVELARRIRDFSTPTLLAELDNPLVEDWVKAATRKELDRRLGLAELQ